MNLHLRIAQPFFENVEKCSVFNVFECSNDTIFKMCRWPIRAPFFYRFQNVPFSCELKSVGSPLNSCKKTGVKFNDLFL